LAYHKKLIDNVVCSRRFHLTYDDSALPQPKVEISCKYCGKIVFSAENHPPVTLARDENLVVAATLSDDIIRSCDMKDTFSAQTQPNAQGKDFKIYPRGI
jgi:hypothetical protein